MRLDFGFRLSNYVTLALACICLTQVEATFLPGIGWFLPPLLALLATAFVVEERWNLPTWAANLLALLVTAGFAAGLAYEIHREPNSFVANAPLPIALVPYIGPQLMVLLLIKLFRPKRIADYWQLQAIGLLIVALTCVLGHEPLVGVLLSAYFVSALWCLSLFALHRQPRGTGSTSSRYPVVPWRGYGVPRALSWVIAAMAGGVLLALATPRPSSSQWNPLEMLGQSQPGARSETGVSSWIDLNRTGPIEVNEEVVIEIQAEDKNNNPKTDLDTEQRWRGMYLDQYDNGRWRVAQPRRIMMAGSPMEVPAAGGGGSAMPLSKQMYKNGMVGQNDLQKAGMRPTGGFPDEFYEPGGPPTAPHPQRISGSVLPDLGPNSYFLTFSLQPRKAGGFFLADPVWLLPEHASLPVITVETPTSAGTLFAEFHAGITHMTPSRGHFQYRQVTIALAEPDVGPPVELERAYQEVLLSPPLPSLIAWTDDLLQRLLAKPGVGLKPDDLKLARDGALRMMHPAQREKVARLLCDHLKYSDEYTYTLDLKRQDYELDATEDFLRNVKQGHCERYAGALALMLRAEGIPARIVKGFRGCESHGEGRYQVRNSHAHAWVEALISRPGANGRPRLHWLALDPVAVQEAPASAPFSLSRWWQDCQQVGLEIWRVFVVDYSAEEQEALASGVLSAVTSSNSLGQGRRFPAGVVVALAGFLTLLGLALCGIWLVRRAGRRRTAAAAATVAPSVRFYARLLELLAQHVHLRPAAAQTPREFGATAAQRLSGVLANTNLATLPEQIVVLLYRVRYGGESISEAEELAIYKGLDALATALAAAPQVVAPTPAA
jgi:transglutaminase-like putative cysteine protease